MIITIQGYDGKENHAVMTTACLAAMTASQANLKTLVLQFINRNLDNVEKMLVGIEESEKILGSGKSLFSEEGMDALIRASDNGKLMKEDFEQFTRSLLKSENLLDIGTMTKSSSLETAILGKNKIENIKTLLESASDIYDVIYVLGPSQNEALTKELNHLANKSIYCIRQRHNHACKVYGKNIFYLVTDFEAYSMFSLKLMKKEIKKKGRWGTIPHNIGCTDAAMNGNLLRFIRINRQNEPADVNYTLSENLKGIVDALVLEKKETKGKPLSFLSIPYKTEKKELKALEQVKAENIERNAGKTKKESFWKKNKKAAGLKNSENNSREE